MPNGNLSGLGIHVLKTFLEGKVAENEKLRSESEDNGYENYDYYDGLVDGYSIALNKLIETVEKH
jgi:hypothetical protein